MRRKCEYFSECKNSIVVYTFFRQSEYSWAVKPTAIKNKDKTWIQIDKMYNFKDTFSNKGVGSI